MKATPPRSQGEMRRTSLFKVRLTSLFKAACLDMSLNRHSLWRQALLDRALRLDVDAAARQDPALDDDFPAPHPL